jgi:predicted transposase/invertase (TIGR01784 family)
MTLTLKPHDILPDPRLDPVFKAVFTQNTPHSKKALKALLCALIGRPITVLSLSANEPPPQKTGDKQIRYDISCKFNNGELADIEMTLFPGSAENLRLEYYAARLFLSQNIKGRNTGYKNLKHTYQISFIGKGRLFPCPHFLHVFRYSDPSCGAALSLGGKTCIITVELEKALRCAGKKAAREMRSAERWAIFLGCAADTRRRELVNQILKAEEGIGMAAKSLVAFTREEVEWFRNESRLKYELDRQDRRYTAKENAIKKVKRELRKKFREEFQQKVDKAKNEANLQTKRETALRFKNMGLTAEQIAEGTGLSPEEIQNL